MNDKNTLMLDRKTAARLSAGAIVGIFAIFTTGYFTGKRHALQEVALQTQTESFNDTIGTALDSMYQPQQCTYYTPFEEQQDVAYNEPEDTQPAPTPEPATRYYAELVGFGARRNAQTFVEKMNQRDIDVRLQERTSSTKQGKQVTWFQILSPQFDRKDALDTFLTTVKTYENLHDIRIREVHA